MTATLRLAALAIPLAVLVGSGQQPTPPPAAGPQAPSAAPSRAPNEALEVPAPPFSDGIFPCTFCHDADLKSDPTPRTLDDHPDIVLKHDEQNIWCLGCHDSKDRDSLHLANGKLVSFDQSYLLCGQCHGEKYRDWLVGVHGRRTGYWNGQKKYLLCVNCHDPHQPHFKPMEPKPAPLPPMRPR